MGPGLRAILFFTFLFGFSSLASAQVSDEARAAFEEGERQYVAGNHQLALEAFERVRELSADNPRARAIVGYNIAKCYDRLGRLADALREYEQYLADAPSDAPYREETLDRVRDLRGRVASEAASAPEVAEPEPTEPSAPDEASSGSVLVPVGVAVLSVGGAALLAAIPTGVLALDRGAELDATCPGGSCPQSAQGLLDDAYLLGTLTDVFWIAGLSVAAIGAVLLTVGVVSEGSEAPSVGAACMEEGCVATFTSRF